MQFENIENPLSNYILLYPHLSLASIVWTGEHSRVLESMMSYNSLKGVNAAKV